VVAAASYEVRKFGIHSAMPMSQARKICPSLVIVPPDHAHYAQASAAVFEIFQSFTPEVEGVSLDEAFLDISGLRLHFPSPVAVGEALRTAVRDRVGLPVSVGIAANKLVAKLASEAAKPDGLRYVPAPEIQAFLHPLPVRAISGVGEATQAALEALGVVTIGDLAGLDPALLVRRLGASAGRQLAALARGEDDRPVEPDRLLKSMSVSETYEYDLSTPEQVATELLRLCDRLAARLHRANRTGRTVSLTVRYSDFETVVRQMTRSSAVANTHDLLTTATGELRSQFDWSRPVRLLGVGLSHFDKAEDTQQMSTEFDPRWDQVGSAIAGVRERFGHDSVRPARIVESKGKRS
jgi:DNA polymerase-4